MLFVPTFLWNFSLGRVLGTRRWWDRIDPYVILGAMPLKSDASKLFDEGVRGVVNMCREYPGPTAEYQRLGMQQLWLPTVDFNPPTLEQVEEGVEFVQSHVTKQESVYVHCKAGRARSATILICWLVRYKGLSLVEAQDHLLKCRPHVNPKLHLRQVVLEYVSKTQKANRS
jgi:atypical dual specificity phosphatase